jgi:hypothetical protein
MTQRDVDRVMLVLYAVREAGARGSLEQMKAICYCLRNRVRAGWGEWVEVIETADEGNAHEPAEKIEIDVSSRAYQRLLRDVDDIYFGQSSLNGFGDEEGSEGGTLESSLCEPEHAALYWCFVNRPIRPWFAQTIVQDPKNHANRATMTLMNFYE